MFKEKETRKIDQKFATNGGFEYLHIFWILQGRYVVLSNNLTMQEFDREDFLSKEDAISYYAKITS